MGVMNEEPDVHPNDIVLNFSLSEWKAFIRQKYFSIFFCDKKLERKFLNMNRISHDNFREILK